MLSGGREQGGESSGPSSQGAAAPASWGRCARVRAAGVVGGAAGSAGECAPLCRQGLVHRELQPRGARLVKVQHLLFELPGTHIRDPCQPLTLRVVLIFRLSKRAQPRCARPLRRGTVGLVIHGLVIHELFGEPHDAARPH